MRDDSDMSGIFNYFEKWRQAELICPQCGWKGNLDPKKTDAYRDLFEFRCPNCSTIIAIVNFPTKAEIKQHWDSLSDIEKQLYGSRFQKEDEFARHHLSEPSQLPDIDDDRIVLMWDIEPEGVSVDESFVVIKYRDKIIWREPAYYECVDRFGEVVNVLLQKYGDRLEDLVPTEWSHVYLGGDDLSAWDKLRAIRKRMSPDNV